MVFLRTTGQWLAKFKMKAAWPRCFTVRDHMGLQRVGHDWAPEHTLHTHTCKVHIPVLKGIYIRIFVATSLIIVTGNNLKCFKIGELAQVQNIDYYAADKRR